MLDGDQAVEYVEVTADDIAQANALAHEVLGRSLDELPPQTRRLLRRDRRSRARADAHAGGCAGRRALHAAATCASAPAGATRSCACT